MEQFDPYHTWLGIPPEEQPPDHYRLIGVRRFEDNPNVITNGMDRQMQFLRSLQAGKRSALSQDLLNEISAAAGCLLDRQRKVEYDRQLKQQIAQRERQAQTLQPLPPADFLAPASMPVLSAPLIQSGKREPQPSILLPIVVGSAAGVIALVLVALVGQWLLNENPAPEPIASTATEKSSPAKAVPNDVQRVEAAPQAAAVLPASVPEVATAPPAPPATIAAASPLAETIVQPADDAMFQTFLGRYMYWLDRTKMYPIVNLQVPNKNLWNADVKANAAGRAPEEEISYVGTAKFLIPADGTYLLGRDRSARVRIDDQIVSDWEMPRQTWN